MEHNEMTLTPTEWHLMECLWEHSPRTGREAIDYMKASVGWSRSTTLTMLKRMSDKGIIECQEENGLKIYSPMIQRDAAAQRETDNFLSRVYQGSISTMMNAITRKQKLSKSEIEELYAIIRQAEEET